MTDESDRIVISADDLSLDDEPPAEVVEVELEPDEPPPRAPPPGDDGSEAPGPAFPAEPGPAEARHSLVWAIGAQWSRAALGAVVAIGAAVAGCLVLGIVGGILDGRIGGPVASLRVGLWNVLAASGATTRSEVAAGSDSVRFWIESVSGTAVLLLGVGAWIGNRLAGRGRDLADRLLVLVKVTLLCAGVFAASAVVLDTGPGGGVARATAWQVAVGAGLVTLVGGGVAVLLHPTSSDANRLRRTWLAPFLTGARTYALVLVVGWAVVMVAGSVLTDAPATMWLVGTVFAPNLAGLAVAVASGGTVVARGSPFESATDVRLGELAVADGHFDGTNPVFWLLLAVPLVVLTLGARRALHQAAAPTLKDALSVECRFALGAALVAALALCLADLAGGLDPAGGGVTDIVDLDLALPTPLALTAVGIVIAMCIALLLQLRRGFSGPTDEPLTVIFDGP